MTEPRNSKQAEKTYLSRTGGSAWEREKPFSPPANETFDDSLELLHDFAVAAKLLQPSQRIGSSISEQGPAGAPTCCNG